MKKLIIVLVVIFIYGCDRGEPNVNPNTIIDGEWFNYHYDRIENSKAIISYKAELLLDTNLDYATANTIIFNLENSIGVCLNYTNLYNKESLSFDEAQFELWFLPKVLLIHSCYVGPFDSVME